MNLQSLHKIWIAIVLIVTITSCTNKTGNKFNLSNAAILISPSIKTPVNETAGKILVEEIGKRTSLQLKLTKKWDNKTIVACALSKDKNLFGEVVPKRSGDNFPESKKEGFRLFNKIKNGKNIVWIIGNDERGILYGIGKLLRIAEMKEGEITIANGIDISTSPEYPIRGHQFGYRNTANSWDSWTVKQFDQHFREQVLFGANSFENIPFQDSTSSPHFKVNPKEMEVQLSKICDSYDADYWVWTPAPNDLTLNNSYEEGLKEQGEFYAACPRLDGVFVPGGDPGDNHPSVLLPYLKDLSAILHKYHPKAGMWVSLQGFNREKTEYFFKYLEEEKPDWLKGLVNGPSSPPLEIEREHLPKKYMLRAYPDITHSVRCQYPVKKWDQAFALTLGRECTNPQALYYARIHNQNASYTDGFISYSDGVHDDVNKVVWSQMGWDTKSDVRNILVEYSRFFFGANPAENAADGILALEQNWVGPLLGNPVIGETLKLWEKLEAENPQLAKNWRWQQLVMRAYYDAYIQQRLTYEKRLETEANEILANAKTLGVDKAMNEALAHVQKADKEFVAQDLKQKAVQYCDDLFQSVGLQTSVPKYQASGYERGCVLDFIDYPLNNRWWLEDEFKKIRKMKTEPEKLARLEFIRTYENPGEGSFYDNISSADAL
ncbi:MAG: hypothetical protein L3J11_12210, partial [Draconibacterium sp.]|nr:hypothetical protein [Draconibacterium sp.]